MGGCAATEKDARSRRVQSGPQRRFVHIADPWTPARCTGYPAPSQAQPGEGGTMKHPRWARALYAAALIPPLFVLVSAGPSFAKAKPNLSAKTVPPSSHITSAKSPTSRMAQSDKTLLKRTD